MLKGTKGLALALCSAMLLTALDATAARFYKSIDENGKVIFSDRPAGSSSEQIDVQVFTPNVAPPRVPGASDSASTTKKNGEETKKGDEEKKAKEDVKALQATRDDNCKKVKEQLQKLQTVSRLYTEDGKGNRNYISDEDRIKQLADVRKSIKEWCK